MTLLHLTIYEELLFMSGVFKYAVNSSCNVCYFDFELDDVSVEAYALAILSKHSQILHTFFL